MLEMRYNFLKRLRLQLFVPDSCYRQTIGTYRDERDTEQPFILIGGSL